MWKALIILALLATPASAGSRKKVTVCKSYTNITGTTTTTCTSH